MILILYRFYIKCGKFHIESLGFKHNDSKFNTFRLNLKNLLNDPTKFFILLNIRKSFSI